MSKILKRTGADFLINDTGETVPANGQLTIQPAKYNLYAMSSDTITALAAGDLVYNDGSDDLSLADATLHLQGMNPKHVEIDRTPPFANKQIIDAQGNVKDLFKRVHGCNTTIAAGATKSLDFSVPWPVAKFTGAEIFGVDLKDTLNFYVLDDANNTYSGLDVGTYGANFTLNQFGFNVEMPPGGEYANTSNYDADIYFGMIIRCEYTNNGTASKYIAMNPWLHEVK